MVEEQVDIKGLVADHQRNLAADEGEAAAQLEQQIAEVEQQAAFELALLIVVGQGEEVEVVGVAQDLLRHIGALGG